MRVVCLGDGAQPDPAARCALYSTIQKKVKDEAIMEFWSDPEILYATSNKLSDVLYYLGGNTPYFAAALSARSGMISQTATSSMSAECRAIASKCFSEMRPQPTTASRIFLPVIGAGFLSISLSSLLLGPGAVATRV